MQPGFLRREGSCICCISLRVALWLQPLSDCHGDLGNSRGDESSPWGVSISPSVGTGQPASPADGCIPMHTIPITCTNCSSPSLITQSNQPQFSAALTKETHSPARIHLSAPSCFVQMLKIKTLLQGKCNLCTLMMQDEQAGLALYPSHFLPQPSHHHPRDKINQKAKLQLSLLSSLKSMLCKANIKFLFKPQEAQTPL